MGSPALTTQGLRKKDFQTIAEIIHNFLQNSRDLDLKEESKIKVKNLVNFLLKSDKIIL